MTVRRTHLWAGRRGQTGRTNETAPQGNAHEAGPAIRPQTTGRGMGAGTGNCRTATERYLSSTFSFQITGQTTSPRPAHYACGQPVRAGQPKSGRQDIARGARGTSSPGIGARTGFLGLDAEPLKRRPGRGCRTKHEGTSSHWPLNCPDPPAAPSPPGWC